MTAKATNLFLNRYTSLSSALHLLWNMRIDLLDPKSWDDKNDVHFMEAYRRSKKEKLISAVCFAQASETYHHWKVFAPNSDGICIQFDKQSIVKASESIPNVFQGNVEYKTIKQVRESNTLTMDKLPFIKRRPYEPESEYRVGCLSSNASAGPASIVIESKFIKKITLSPWMHKAVAESVKKTISAIPSCSRLKIVRSTLVGNLEWQETAEIIETIQELV